VRFRFAFELVRGPEWWYSKVQPLLFFIYIHLYGRVYDHPYAPIDAYVTSFFLLMSVCSVAMYGHLINDYFDQQADKKANKSRLLSKYTKKQSFTLLILFVISGFLPAVFIEYDPLAITLLFLNYLAATFYSAPPVRFKERGVLGIVFASVAQRAIPTLFVNAGFAGSIATEHQREIYLVLTEMAWAFMVGVRWIVIHQLRDEKNDILSDVKTFVTSHKSSTATSLLKHIILPLELLALFVLLLMLITSAPLLIVVVFTYLITSIMKLRKHDLSIKEVLISHKLPFPPALFDLYEIWLPLGFAILLTMRAPSYCGFVILQIICFNHHNIFPAQKVKRLLRFR
jgi:4-hydroxybenzoate polyprenyltransferase